MKSQLTFFLFLASFLSGCGEDPSRMRTYEEWHEPPAEVAATAVTTMPNSSAPQSQNVPITWNVPEGWNEGSGDQLRVVIFTTPEPHATESSIVILPGDAGGLDANIRRWFGQLGLTNPTQASIDELITAAETMTTSSGEEAQVIDFTATSSGSTDKQSMITALIEQGSSTTFIKITGTTGALEHHRAAFLMLIRSIEFSHE